MIATQCVWTNVVVLRQDPEVDTHLLHVSAVGWSGRSNGSARLVYMSGEAA